MQILLNEEKRVIGTTPDGIEWNYPDERWEIISIDDEIVNNWIDEYINYIWNGNEIIYSPKQY